MLRIFFPLSTPYVVVILSKTFVVACTSMTFVMVSLNNMTADMAIPVNPATILFNVLFIFILSSPIRNLFTALYQLLLLFFCCQRILFLPITKCTIVGICRTVIVELILLSNIIVVYLTCGLSAIRLFTRYSHCIIKRVLV